jgi:hypothetical protein
MKKKTQSKILIVIVVGLLALAFRDPNYGKWGVPYDLDHAVSRVGGNISSGAEYMKDLVHGKNQEMQDVHDNRMDRNDSRIERAGGKGR